MTLPSPGFLIEAFALVLRRFPATMLSAFMGVLSLLVLLEDNGFSDEWRCMLMVSALGLPLLTGLVAFSESKGWSAQRGLMAQGIGIALLVGYWFLLDPKLEGFEYRELPSYFALLIVAHLFVAVAPYLNDRPVRDFWEYNKELFANIVVGVCFTLILFAGLSLAILAVDQLFDIGLSEKIYLRLFFVLAGVFNTSYFLFHFPKDYTFDSADNTYTAIFKNLCKYILIPIVGLYFLILYAYSFKILSTWSLPKGWVGSLVTGFSVAGILTYLLNFYLPEQDSTRHVHAYKRWFWWILLPLTVLLCIAIGRRIGDYGVTEVRFLVAQVGVWLALNCLYFLLGRKDNIKFIPISLAIFTLGWAFGPLSARAVSERSQLGRITRILEQTGRLEQGKMKQGTTSVTEMEADQLESAVDFLERRNRLDLLTPMLPMPADQLPEVEGYYGTAGRLRAWLGMAIAPADKKGAKSINVYSKTPVNAIDIRGFATFKPLTMNGSSKTVFEDKGDYFQLAPGGKSLEWLKFDGKSTTLVEQFDVQPLVKQWFSQLKGAETYHQLLPPENMKDFIGKKGSLRIYIESGLAELDGADASINYLNGYIFIK